MDKIVGNLNLKIPYEIYSESRNLFIFRMRDNDSGDMPPDVAFLPVKKVYTLYPLFNPARGRKLMMIVVE